MGNQFRIVRVFYRLWRRNVNCFTAIGIYSPVGAEHMLMGIAGLKSQKYRDHS